MLSATKKDKYSRTHELKINREYFERVYSGQKRFEIRKNDRDFQVNDWVYLCCENQKLAVKIIYVTNYEQKQDYVVFGFTLGEEP